MLIDCSLHLPSFSVFIVCHGHTSGQPIAPIFPIFLSSSSSSNWRIRWGNMFVYIHTYIIKSRNKRSWKIKNCKSYNNDYNADARYCKVNYIGKDMAGIRNCKIIIIVHLLIYKNDCNGISDCVNIRLLAGNSLVDHTA